MRFRGLLAFVLIIIVAISVVFAAFWFRASWVNVGVGTAMLIVDASTRSIGAPILGPTAGFYIDGFKRFIGLQYPVFIFVATDTFEDTITCFSSDQLEMGMEVLMRWDLDPSKVQLLYSNYPNLNYKEKAIESIMEKTIRLVTKNFTTLETIAFRETVVHTIEQEVYKAIREEESLGGALYHLEMDVKNIGYPVKYTEAIEAKLAAEQAKIQAQFEYERLLTLAQADAQSKIIVANGTRQAIETIIQVTGETNSTRIAELYLTLETLKTVAPNTESFIVIFGEGAPLVYPIPTDSTAP